LTHHRTITDGLLLRTGTSVEAKENAMKVVIAEQERQTTDEAADDGNVRRRVDDHPIASRVNHLRRSGTRVEQLLTVAEAAQCVGCCEETIRRAYLARQLGVLRFGARRVRIRPSALVAWLERGGKTTAV
jgi:excisionase family DNA binding protein